MLQTASSGRLMTTHLDNRICLSVDDWRSIPFRFITDHSPRFTDESDSSLEKSNRFRSTWLRFFTAFIFGITLALPAEYPFRSTIHKPLPRIHQVLLTSNTTPGSRLWSTDLIDRSEKRPP